MGADKLPSSSDLPESLEGLTTAHFSASPQTPSRSYESSPENPPRPTPGSLFDGYEVIETLGEGGMGVVYKVKRGEELFALKALQTSSNDFSLRFQREAKIIGQLQHPNIVQMHKFQTAAPWPYIVFDYVEGSTLEALIQSRGPIPFNETIAILDPIAKALDQIHSQGIFHRDIKPANILIRAEDSASILTDFGLAKVTHLDSLTKTGEVLGTLFYMAPEQFVGKKCQAQTDVWALGLVLYSMVTGGKRPFRNPSAPAYAHNVLFSAPIALHGLAPELPPALDLVIAKALHKEPLSRYRSASAFILDCQRVLNNEETIARKPSLYQRFQQNWIRRFGRPSLYVLFVIVILSTVFALKEVSSFIQHSQRHNQFEAENLPQFLSIIERCKARKEALDSDIVRHLSSQQRTLPCCQSVSSLQHDLSELENKTALFKAQQPHSQFINKRLLTIQKLQESIRILTLIHQVTAPLKEQEFPSKHRQFFQVLSRMLQRDYNAARHLLESEAQAPKALCSAFKFAKALCFYQCEQFNDSTVYFTELKNQRYHESVVSQYLIDSLIQKSVQEFYEAPFLKEKFSTTLNRALEYTQFNTEKAIKRWDKLIQDRFQSKESDLSNKNREQVYLAYRSFTHSHPELDGLTLTKRHWEQCLK
ncbi:MAG: serine/threonine-protein kinase, partial [Planctomycetota bacterium]|nr:serine/threonine-protein kinase [Planctomycetota bacterium]